MSLIGNRWLWRRCERCKIFYEYEYIEDYMVYRSESCPKCGGLYYTFEKWALCDESIPVVEEI
jgi:transcriptional regulator NrdR family protein